MSEAFQWCKELTSVTLPSSITLIGSEAFDKIDLQVVVSLNKEPKEIYGKLSGFMPFSLNTFNNATLYVPVGTKERYKETKGWMDFLFIEEGEGPKQNR